MPYNPYMPYQSTWQQQPQPINGLVSVTGIEGAKAYQLPPNSSMPLFDANSDILYLKTTDGAGFPTVRAFSFTEIGTEQPTHDYVTREDFNALVKRVEGLTPKPRTRKADGDGE